MTYVGMSEYKASLGCLFWFQLLLLGKRENMKKKEIIGGSFRAEYSLSISPQERYIIVNSNTNIYIYFYFYFIYIPINIITYVLIWNTYKYLFIFTCYTYSLGGPLGAINNEGSGIIKFLFHEDSIFHHRNLNEGM